MRSAKQAIQYIVRRRPRNGEDYPTFTNADLLGVEPQTELERYGVDSRASLLRNEIEPTLENEHGLGLVPLNYRGLWVIADIDKKAAHILTKRLARTCRLLIGDGEGEGILTQTVMNYITNPYISPEMEKDLVKWLAGLAALEIVAVEVVQSRLHGIQGQASKYLIQAGEFARLLGHGGDDNASH